MLQAAQAFQQALGAYKQGYGQDLQLGANLAYGQPAVQVQPGLLDYAAQAAGIYSNMKSASRGSSGTVPSRGTHQILRRKLNSTSTPITNTTEMATSFGRDNDMNHFSTLLHTLSQFINTHQSHPRFESIQQPSLDTSGSESLAKRSQEYANQAANLPRPQGKARPTDTEIALALLPALMGQNPRYLGTLMSSYQHSWGEEYFCAKACRTSGTAGGIDGAFSPVFGCFAVDAYR